MYRMRKGPLSIGLNAEKEGGHFSQGGGPRKKEGDRVHRPHAPRREERRGHTNPGQPLFSTGRRKRCIQGKRFHQLSSTPFFREMGVGGVPRREHVLAERRRWPVPGGIRNRSSSGNSLHLQAKGLQKMLLSLKPMGANQRSSTSALVRTLISEGKKSRWVHGSLSTKRGESLKKGEGK